MPAATAKRQTKDQRRQMARDHARELKRLAVQEASRRQEEADEAIAPSVQRKAVLDASGDVLRAPRVERDGVAFVRASPLSQIAARMEKGETNFRPEHLIAARRLAMSWESVGLGVGPASIDLGMPRATRSKAPATPPGHTALIAQVDQQRELHAVCAYLKGVSPSWPCLHAIVVRGLSPTAWAKEFHIEPKSASGILLMSLSLLVRIYADIDPKIPPTRHRLRTWAPERARAADA